MNIYVCRYQILFIFGLNLSYSMISDGSCVYCVEPKSMPTHRPSGLLLIWVKKLCMPCRATQMMLVTSNYFIVIIEIETCQKIFCSSQQHYHSLEGAGW